MNHFKSPVPEACSKLAFSQSLSVHICAGCIFEAILIFRYRVASLSKSLNQPLCVTMQRISGWSHSLVRYGLHDRCIFQGSPSPQAAEMLARKYGRQKGASYRPVNPLTCITSLFPMGNSIHIYGQHFGWAVYCICHLLHSELCLQVWRCWKHRGRRPKHRLDSWMGSWGPREIWLNVVRVERKQRAIAWGRWAFAS